MENHNSRRTEYFNWFCYISLVFTLMHMLSIGIGLKIGLLTELALLTLICILMKRIVYRPVILYFIFVAIIFSIMVANRFYQEQLIGFLYLLVEFTENVLANLKYSEQILKEFALPLYIITSALVATFTVLVVFRKFNLILLIPLHLGTFLVYWYNFYDQAYRHLVIFVFIYLLLWSSRVNKDTSLTSWSRTAFRYSVIILIAALITPKTNRHLIVPKLQSAVHRVFPAIEDLRSSDLTTRGIGTAEGFDFSTTGFQSESNRLGGPVVLKTERVMSVKSSRALYLRGNVNLFYTGDSWESRNEPSRIISPGEDLSGLSDLEKELYYDKLEISVRYRTFATTTIFSPLVPEKLYSADTKNFVAAKNNYIAVPGGLFDNEGYSLSAMIPKPYGIRLFNGQNESVDELYDRDSYLQLPKNKITDRTVELTQKIVEDIDTPMDKALAIEDFLRNNYSYELNAEYLPEGREFVDYFLFESKEGYCTYFATAMAVMLRSIDIPTRYIEGFVARGPHDEGVYEITLNNAHSWVEAFIEPVGWVTFEPTPSQPLPIRLLGFTTEETDSSDNPPILNTESENIIEESPVTVTDVNGTNDRNGYSILLSIFAIALILAFPLRLAWGAYKYSKNKEHIASLDSKERTVIYYDYIMKLLKRLDYPVLPGETHNEYAKRISYKFGNIDGTGIVPITEVFIRTKYGGNEPNNVELEAFDVFALNLEMRMKKKYGKLRYWYYKYIKEF